MPYFPRSGDAHCTLFTVHCTVLSAQLCYVGRRVVITAIELIASPPYYSSHSPRDRGKYRIKQRGYQRDHISSLLYSKVSNPEPYYANMLGGELMKGPKRLPAQNKAATLSRG